MAVCQPCGHTVDEKTALSWKYKDVTFYFCAPGCEEEVKAEPDKWLKVANSASSRKGGHERHSHNHVHG